MLASDNTAQRPQRVLLLLFVVGLVGLIALIGSVAWLASSWDMGRMMESNQMGGMMGNGGRDSSGDPAQQGNAEQVIMIENFAYSPGNLEVPVGSRITWTNRDSAPHSATDVGGAWDTGVLARGKSAMLTFERAGTFDYYCTVHPDMRARLVVR